MAVPSATPASPSGPARTRLRTRLSTPAPRNVSDGSTGFPSPISTGRATPRTGRKIRLEIMRIWSTAPAGPSNEASIHQPMKRGPSTMRNRPTIMVRQNAIFDQRRKIARSSPRRPWVLSRVVVGITTAAMATMNSSA